MMESIETRICDTLLDLFEANHTEAKEINKKLLKLVAKYSSRLDVIKKRFK